MINYILHQKEKLIVNSDDTAVAVVETQSKDRNKPIAKIHFHTKITANNSEFKGIHPLNSARSHQIELPGLIHKALRHLPIAEQDDERTISFADCSKPLRRPDFISATRGPGMRSGLTTGLSMAKGISLAYDIPLMGVHHMQAHALTPRFVSALSTTPSETILPEFPFRSLLVSGGHTILVNGKTLTDFEQEITTLDMVAGDCIDKMARFILPESILNEHDKDTNYGAPLESFAFPNGEADYHYTPPKNREDVLTPHPSIYGWAVPPPLQGSAGRVFSFSSLDSAIRQIVLNGSARLSQTQNQPRTDPMKWDERRELARQAQRVIFEHIADRIHIVLKSNQSPGKSVPSKKTANAQKRPSLPHQLVVSGGVASNKFLRHVLNKVLESRGIDAKLIFPPGSLCTDNAIMIAWAGIEMWEAGWRSKMDCTIENRWPLAAGGEDDDNGLIGTGGWWRSR